MTHEVLIEVKDIDEVTTTEEICKALSDQLEEARDIPVTAIRSMREAYGGTRTAIIGLPVGVAERLTSISKVRSSWVVCRLREKKTVLRCFKCLNYGHLARACRSAWLIQAVH